MRRSSVANKRLHAYYSGMVQGVGFRYTAQDSASRLGLTGWVKNLRDGRVEVVAEGSEELLKKFFRHVGDAMGHYIEDAETSWSDATGEFGGFEILFL